jgi:DHA2 family methylenomycin A resistance protein-like MFS transporter
VWAPDLSAPPKRRGVRVAGPGLATGISDTARQTGTATGIAVFGSGRRWPGRVSQFVSAVHQLAVLATALWAAAAVLAAITIERRSGR